MLKAGFAETAITPKDGKCLLAGYGEGHRATGVHDDLYASAVYLEEGGTRALLISFDLIGLSAELISRLKKSVQSALDLDANNIFFTCTHTHEGPSFRPDAVSGELDYVEGYLAFLGGQIERVSGEAEANARECELMVNRAYVDENMNRRFFFASGENLYVSSYKDLVPITYGHADKELGMVYFCPVGDKHPYGMIVNYTVHPLTAGDTSSLISADVPGVIRNLVKEGMGCMTCYVTGAAGDNHPKAPEGGFAETRRMGGVLATEAIKRRWDAYKLEGPLTLKCLTRSITLKRRSVEEFRSIPMTPYFAPRLEKMISRMKGLGEPMDVAFSLLAIGPLLFIGVPGELVAELGSILKWSSPFQRTYIMYQATDSLGYIGHPNAFKWGGYEATNGVLSPASVRPLINAIIDAAEELAGSLE